MGCRGSITVFASLALTVVMSLIFTLLESARLYGLQTHTQTESRLLIESVMAQYHIGLYEQYHLYFREANVQGELSFASLEKDLKALGQENLEGRVSAVQSSYSNLYGLKLTDCFVTGYELATDFGGAAYRQQAADYMKHMIGVLAVDEWKEKAEQTEELLQQEDDIREKWNQANQAQDHSQEQSSIAIQSNGQIQRVALRRVTAPSPHSDASVPAEPDTSEADPVDNPITEVRKLMDKGILSQVVDDVSSVSGRSLKGESLSERELFRGSYGESTADTNMMDDAWFREYLLREFGCFVEPEQQGALSYPQEYFIAGRSSDLENLTAVVERLLVVREVANYLWMRQDAQKSALAHSMALVISTLLLQPELVDAITQGILIAWAYMESVSDVRTLLEGGRVPLLKQGNDIQEIHAAAAVGSEKETAASEGSGLSYQDYLRIFMYLTGKEKLTMRSLDFMEKSIRLLEGEEQFAMDCVVAVMEISCRYQAEPLFFGWFGSGEGWKGNYLFVRNQKAAYQ